MAGHHEPPRLAGPRLSRVRHADPRRRADGRSRDRVDGSFETDARVRIAEVESRDAAIDPEGRADQAGPARQAVVRRPFQAGQFGGFVPAEAAPPLGGHVRPIGPHRRETLEGFDRADEQGGRAPVRAGHDVQAVIHPVDKVHVGDARRPEHDRVPLRPARTGMRRPVVGARIGLQLHDPPDPTAVGVLTDQPRAEQVPCRLEGRSGEDRAIDDAQDA